ncbi:MAG: L,D-transpeptidase family protein [Armatimonadetes bacterium]|nr:L,D-transpeptidase family protein [Armatimonadota bacterium]
MRSLRRRLSFTGPLRAAFAIASILLLGAGPGSAGEAPRSTLLYLGADGLLRMASISEREARLPQTPLAPGRAARRLAVSPEGARLLLEVEGADDRRTLWLVQLDSRQATALGAGLLLPDGPASPFSPDGKRIVLRRQGLDQADLFWATTGRRYRTLEIPGLEEAPAWFGDCAHLAAPVRTPDGGSALWIVHGDSGEIAYRVLGEVAAVPRRFAGSAPGLLIYRETREGVDLWQGVRADGSVEPALEPTAPKVAPDLPEGVVARPSPGGEWVAYLQDGGLHVRYNVEGAAAVRLASAGAFLWKPGAPLSEQAVAPKPAAPTAGAASAPGLLVLQAIADEAVEADGLAITWAAGPEVASVRLSAHVVRTPKGTIRRGPQTIAIARVAAGHGSYRWEVPWIDSLRFTLRAEALDAALRPLARAEQALSFRPKELADDRRDGIFVHLSEPKRQRIYVQERGQLTMMLLCSGASTSALLPPNQHPDAPHDHYGTFRITAKDPDHVSNLDPTWKMPYAMRYLGGHWIHVTARNQYHRLGGPGSHGCIRLHRADGIRLYERTKIGEMVVIY